MVKSRAKPRCRSPGVEAAPDQASDLRGSYMRLNTAFGRRVRALRAEQGWGLRKFAKAVGVSPTYLSKIERGEFPPPAEDKVVAIADTLGQDRDELLALAGRIATELAEVIRSQPRELAALLRVLQHLPPEAVRRVTETARRMAPGERAGEGENGPVGYGRHDGVAEEPPELLP